MAIREVFHVNLSSDTQRQLYSILTCDLGSKMTRSQGMYNVENMQAKSIKFQK